MSLFAFKEKKDIGILSSSKTRNTNLGRENWVRYSQELRFFSQRTSIWRFKNAAIIEIEFLALMRISLQSGLVFPWH